MLLAECVQIVGRGSVHRIHESREPRSHKQKPLASSINVVRATKSPRVKEELEQEKADAEHLPA